MTPPKTMKKIPKTPWVFFAFIILSICFAWTQYIVPLEHVSTEERLQASKDSFTRPRPSNTAAGANKQKYPVDRPDYHVVFSTSCTDQQNWESFVFFYRAFKVQQPGNVTRIASACTPEEAKHQTDFFNKHIRPMNPAFHLHLTPDYGTVAKANGHYYKYMNKPFGLRHWMEHALKMNPATMQAPNKQTEDSIIILMDPDMILLRPITHDYSDVDNHIWAEDKTTPLTRVVRHGYPMAQQDGYLSNQWMELDADFIANRTKDQHEPIPKRGDGPLHWNTGPPYLATARDMYRIAVRWTEYAPRVVVVYPQLFAEMYGFIYATVELKLPFTLVKSIVVSVVTTPNREGWNFVDALKDDEVCDPPSTARLPIALHYCKRYALGKWFFSKYRLKKNIMDCEKALLAPPPRDLAAQKLDYFIPPPRADGKDKDTYKEEKSKVNPKHSNREAFMICGLTKAINEAMTYLKQHACGEHGNFNQTYTIHDDPSNY
mmetsp:Transcript_20456/g.38788  ORF Transcript_20456/g.38788 Transcript_20456/m.38788 type:complete len:488 (+) Transcript_20456:206-1669(+)